MFLATFLKCCVLILLVCACPVYHCVICVYAIRSSDRNFPINTYLLTDAVTVGLLLISENGSVLWRHHRQSTYKNAYASGNFVLSPYIQPGLSLIPHWGDPSPDH